MEPDPGSYSWKLLLIKDARVHYVVLKQQPQTTHPTQQHARSVQPGNQKQTSPTPPSLPRKGTRGPWSCCLRTQQCAKHYPAIHTGERSKTLPRENPYLLPACTARHLFVDIPPVSTRRRTIACATGLLPDNPHTRTYIQAGCCRRSLERR